MPLKIELTGKRLKNGRIITIMRAVTIDNKNATCFYIKVNLAVKVFFSILSLL